MAKDHCALYFRESKVDERPRGDLDLSPIIAKSEHEKTTLRAEGYT